MVASADGDGPIEFMDTGPAAAFGALHDERVSACEERVVLNLGTCICWDFTCAGRQIASLFEHHTGELAGEQIVTFTERLAKGTLTNEEIFQSKGTVRHADRGLVRAELPGMVA